MPRKPHPQDWDRYFGPRPRRRRGPLGLLSFTTVAGLMLAALIILGNVGVKAYTVQSATRDRLTITPLWATTYARQSAVARAKTAEALATPTAQPTLAHAHVNTNANLRSTPALVAGNILAQLTPTDELAVLAGQPQVNPEWYHVRIIKAGGALKEGTEGWVSATIVTVEPLPAPLTEAATSPATVGPAPVK